MQIAPYVPGKSKASGGKQTFKLSSNESPLGASPKAMEAFRAVADQLHLYPDGGSEALREAIAARYGLNPRHIVCGAGSDELLQLIAHAYLGPGDEAIHTTHGFLVYPIAIRANGATPVVAAETDLTASVDNILGQGDGEDGHGVPCQPQQPDRHLYPLQRGQAPGPGAAPPGGAGGRCGLCGICAAQRL